ncbi:MAG: response regulator [Bacteroidetes bacterium]|nr:response regulator [Bacteroidota bacterium]MBK8659005.1 response regulator [Bacteroidota bacterium]
MTPLRIGIVEDELLVARNISILLQKMGYTALKPVRNYTDALKMISTESPDLLLLDIIIEGDKDGIQLAETINSQFHIPFVFLTANSDEATIQRAKAVRPSAYLLKPFYEKDLYTSIEIAFNNFNLHLSPAATAKAEPAKPKDFIFIKEGSAFQKVLLNNIMVIESEHVYLHVHTMEKTFMIRSKLEEFMGNYPQLQLIRVHRSFAINLAYLDSIDQLHVVVGGRHIPVSKNYRQELLNSIDTIK